MKSKNLFINIIASGGLLGVVFKYFNLLFLINKIYLLQHPKQYFSRTSYDLCLIKHTTFISALIHAYSIQREL